MSGCQPGSRECGCTLASATADALQSCRFLKRQSALRATCALDPLRKKRKEMSARSGAKECCLGPSVIGMAFPFLLSTPGAAGRSSRKNLDSTKKVFIFSKFISTDVLRKIWREVTRKNAEARLEGIDSRVGTAASSIKGAEFRSPKPACECA